MSRIEKVEWKDGRPAVNPQDETILTNKLVPKSWKCPHCGQRNKTGHYADEILMENFKYLEHCPHCGYVHVWILKLTDDFKKAVADQLLKAVRV